MRYFGEGHPFFLSYLEHIRKDEIGLPSVVVAEVLRGRCEYALKADPNQAAFAHKLLVDTQRLLGRFQIVVFDAKSANELTDLLKRHSSRKRYADRQIAATAIAGNHIVVTRNTRDFADILRPDQIQNWIDTPA